MEWRKFNGERLNLPLEETVENAIIKEIELGHRLKICIGSDSQVKGKITEFATVIVFLREKKVVLCISAMKNHTKDVP